MVSVDGAGGRELWGEGVESEEGVGMLEEVELNE